MVAHRCSAAPKEVHMTLTSFLINVRFIFRRAERVLVWCRCMHPKHDCPHDRIGKIRLSANIPTTYLEDATDFTNRTLKIGQMMQYAICDHAIKCRVLKRKLKSIAANEGD